MLSLVSYLVNLLQVYVMTGGVAKNKLTNEEISAILKDSESKFKEQIATGVINVLDKIKYAIVHSLNLSLILNLIDSHTASLKLSDMINR